MLPLFTVVTLLLLKDITRECVGREKIPENVSKKKKSGVLLGYSLQNNNTGKMSPPFTQSLSTPIEVSRSRPWIGRQNNFRVQL